MITIPKHVITIPKRVITMTETRTVAIRRREGRIGLGICALYGLLLVTVVGMNGLHTLF